jgi:hypothetical protein
MRPYGFHRPDPGIPNEHDKGSERLRTRLELQKALGPVPPSLTAKDEPPCTCEDCTSDPAFAAHVRELEQEEHSHLDEIQV